LVTLKLLEVDNYSLRLTPSVCQLVNRLADPDSVMQMKIHEGTYIFHSLAQHCAVFQAGKVVLIMLVNSDQEAVNFYTIPTDKWALVLRDLLHAPFSLSERLSLLEADQAKPRAPRWTLVEITGPEEGQEFVLSGTMRLGRSPENDICVEDEKISRRQAMVTVTPFGVEIKDLNSANGTYVNYLSIQKIVHLHPWDTISIGDMVFQLRCDVATSPYSGQVESE
jgi:hypothetical protein